MRLADIAGFWFALTVPDLETFVSDVEELVLTPTTFELVVGDGVADFIEE